MFMFLFFLFFIFFFSAKVEGRWKHARRIYPKSHALVVSPPPFGWCCFPPPFGWWLEFQLKETQRKKRQEFKRERESSTT